MGHDANCFLTLLRVPSNYTCQLEWRGVYGRSKSLFHRSGLFVLLLSVLHSGHQVRHRHSKTESSFSGWSYFLSENGAVLFNKTVSFTLRVPLSFYYNLGQLEVYSMHVTQFSEIRRTLKTVGCKYKEKSLESRWSPVAEKTKLKHHKKLLSSYLMWEYSVNF